MFTTTKTVDLTMLYVREGKNPDSDTSRGTEGNSTNDIVYLQLGARKVSVYGQSFDFTRSSTFMCTIASVFSSLAMHARTSPSYLSISLFLCLSPPPSSMRQQYGLVRTQTNREGRTRIGTHTCSRNGVKIRVATLLARHCCVAANSRRTRPPLGNRQPQG